MKNTIPYKVIPTAIYIYILMIFNVISVMLNLFFSFGFWFEFE